MTLYAKNTASMGRLHGGIMFPRNMNPEEFAARKRLSALYLARIARATREKRQELFVEWTEKLYDPQAQRMAGLVKSSSDIFLLRTHLSFYFWHTVMPLVAEARPDDSELEAIRLAIAGRDSAWLATITQRVTDAAAEETRESADPEDIAERVRRRSYRKEVRQWMTHEGLRNLNEASKRLGVSMSALKSMISHRGKRRYGEASLIRILGIIGHAGE